MMYDYPQVGVVRVTRLISTFWGPRYIALERMKLDISNLVCRLNVKCTQCTAITRDLLNIWDMSANISETVQDRHIVTMEH